MPMIESLILLKYMLLITFIFFTGVMALFGLAIGIHKFIGFLLDRGFF